MVKYLLDVIFASDKRKKVLLILKSGPREMRTILQVLDISRQSLLPQMRVLEDNYLVTHSKDIYKLTTIGNFIVNKMAPLLDTLDVFDSDIDYWGTHNLDFIPLDLLERIHELSTCEIVRPPLSSIYELDQKVVKSSYSSKSLFIITTFFHPNYPLLFSDLIQNEVNVYAIVSKEVLETVKEHYHTYLKQIIKSKLFHIYIYPEEMNLQAFVYNDQCILMRILKINGETDNKYVLCSDTDTSGWAQELFEYYLKDSKPITGL